MYNIEYKLKTYEEVQDKLNKITTSSNKYPVFKCDNLGYSSCGFPIEHYKIGNGPIHITYMGGCHGNEIISVDYVLQLMNNIAKGNMPNFDEKTFTIDFIPIQNPEGYMITTYAINSKTKNMTEEEFERFSKEYYLAFREDDINVSKVNKFLQLFLTTFNIEDKLLLTNFWIYFQNKDISIEALFMYFVNHYDINRKELIEFLQTNFTNTIHKERKHTKIFNDLTFDCIPELSDKHKLLKKKVMLLYKQNNFPIGTLANFYANSDGVNLNDNNPYYYEMMKRKIESSKKVLGNMRDNHITKSVPGPIGMPNYDMNKPFIYSNENEALFNFLNQQEERKENFAFFNCHGTGGLLYIYPVCIENDKTTPRDFSFYINNRIATDYTNKTGEVYFENTSKFDPYKTAGYPEQITGVGDVLRKKYIASFILELSKMGGNPLSPYGDKNNNYMLTMKSNFEAFNKTLKTIQHLQELYETSYTMHYDDFGHVHYEISNNRR